MLMSREECDETSTERWGRGHGQRLAVFEKHTGKWALVGDAGLRDG